MRSLFFMSGRRRRMEQDVAESLADATAFGIAEPEPPESKRDAALGQVRRRATSIDAEIESLDEQITRLTADKADLVQIRKAFAAAEEVLAIDTDGRCSQGVVGTAVGAEREIDDDATVLKAGIFGDRRVPRVPPRQLAHRDAEA